MVRADDEEVTVTAGSDIVARDARCWTRHQTLTDPDHATAARLLRGEVVHGRAGTRRSWPPTASASTSNNENWAPTTAMFTIIESGAGQEDT